MFSRLERTYRDRRLGFLRAPSQRRKRYWPSDICNELDVSTNGGADIDPGVSGCEAVPLSRSPGLFSRNPSLSISMSLPRTIRFPCVYARLFSSKTNRCAAPTHASHVTIPDVGDCNILSYSLSWRMDCSCNDERLPERILRMSHAAERVNFNLDEGAPVRYDLK